MREYCIKIKFTQPSLGSHQKKVGRQTIYCMYRSSDGRVMFLPTWWRAITRDAAKVLNKYQDAVKKIRWDPVVKTELKLYRRYTKDRRNGRPRFALHESIPIGGTMEVKCLSPADITANDLREIMSFAGRYYGISPYKPNRYGTFEVLSVVSSSLSSTDP